MKWLIIFRLFGVIIPQTGYVHPDEFFQGPEIAGESIGYDIFKAWEYNSTQPIRSAAFPLLIYLTSFLPLKYFTGLFELDICSYFVLALPRLLMWCISLSNDFCLIKICSNLRLNCRVTIIIFGSSYVCFIYMIRTFSNCLEATLFTILLSITISSFTPSKNKDSNCDGIFIGVILAVGFFIRPTFLLFAITPVGFWFFQECFVKKNILSKLFELIFATLTISSLFLGLDTIYFQRGSFQPINAIENIVITPLNFLLYNSKTSNLKQHGLHPRYLHLLVNIPLMYGALGVVAILSCLKRLPQLHKSTIHDNLLLFSWVVPTMGLSIFPHQEPRFLIPLLAPLVLLHADTIYNNTFLKVTWVASNAVCALIFGTIHQGGLVPFLLDSSNLYPSVGHTTLFFSHTYMVPLHLLQLQNGQSQVEVTDLGFSSVDRIPGLYCKKHCFTVLPGSKAFSDESIDRWRSQGKEINLVRSYFPHLSTEHPPKWNEIWNKNCSVWNSLLNQLSLQVYQIL